MKTENEIKDFIQKTENYISRRTLSQWLNQSQEGCDTHTENYCSSPKDEETNRKDTINNQDLFDNERSNERKGSEERENSKKTGLSIKNEKTNYPSISALMFSDDYCLNTEDQKFINFSTNPIPRNVLILQEYFLSEEKKVSQLTGGNDENSKENKKKIITRSKSSVKIDDIINDNEDDNVNKDLERRNSSYVDLKSNPSENKEKNNRKSTSLLNNNKNNNMFDESQLVDIVTKRLII